MPTLFKRSNGIYYISYETDGKRKWKSTKQSLKAEGRKVLLQFKKQERTSSPNRSLESFTVEFLSYVNGTRSPNTAEIYRRALGHLQKLVGDRHLDSITPRDGDLYRIKRATQVAATSVNIDIRALRAAFSTAIRWKLITQNPFKEVACIRIPERLPLYFSMEDFQKMLSLAKDDWFKDVLVTAAMTGLRRSEILNLKWSDVDFDRSLIHIQSSDTFRTKAGKRRSVPMHDVVKQLLLLRSTKKQSELVFDSGGFPISGDWVTKLTKKCVRKAGLNPELHFHSLRHTFATWLVQAGVSIYEVQKLLGHSSVAVTQIYSHLASSELHDAVRKISLPTN